MLACAGSTWTYKIVYVESPNLRWAHKSLPSSIERQHACLDFHEIYTRESVPEGGQVEVDPSTKSTNRPPSTIDGATAISTVLRKSMDFL